VERKGARFIFHQDIIKKDGMIAASAVVTTVSIKDDKVSRGDELAEVFGKYIK
jgi:hypothetical protein